jgi:asparagine synthase (glutamine-hydrolysing)
MCGITGFVSKRKEKNRESIHVMTACLDHRGPDAEGYFSNEDTTVYLGHRRLSIIDTSDVANQPMYSNCGRYVLVYNGEVYNFKILATKLENHTWRTHSDTEVVLELFGRFGVECFSWFNGMFVLCIYDRQTQEIIIARDQLGIKPLFYYYDSCCFVFGSELKAVRNYLKINNIPLQVNRQSIPYFLHLGFIPEPLTIHLGIFKFPAANYGVIEKDSTQIKLTQYWDAANHFLQEIVSDENHALDIYKELLFASVKSQMVSDVPLGTFLSGGIDSSLVTAVASTLSKRKVKTFSLGFKESKYDESGFAFDVAQYLGCDHHELKVSVTEILELVPSLLDVYDEPFADSSAFPTMLVSKLASEHVKVTLSGDGGDELFLGYGMYDWAKRLDRKWMDSLHRPIYEFSKRLNNRYKRAGTLFNYGSASNLKSHIFSQEQYYFSENELQSLLLNRSFNFEDIKRPIVVSTATAAERQAFWDISHYLKDDLLVKVDRASMHYSIENRVPLLDMRLVEFSLNLKYSLKKSKIYGTKHLMKKTLYEMIPRQLFERPKRGFSIPLQEWLKGPLKYLVTEYLSEHIVAKHAIVCKNNVRSILGRFDAGEDYLFNRIWTLIILHWWLEKEDA